ncbi:hypothetical protein [Nostoc sp. UHCC 0870]|uniref:hypothetical protein n=1 Tax=Nostoc sp. UHCC 0870 TaxID=2914041 RepID=UPI001EDD1F46|nr:hypothetical protein [Nostoc sp. UHCC 0870]UKO99362.1 hypothetical protein L6494_06515 [Nostoc sp. UHCC 0870]
MARKVIVEEAKEIAPVESISLPKEVDSSEFQVEFNQEEGTVKFILTDGTPVEMKSPKSRQFLLLESFLKSADEDYKTESFIALKLASLCMTKFGDKDKVSFDELLDILEVEDIERVAASLSCFRDKLEYLARKSTSV